MTVGLIRGCDAEDAQRRGARSPPAEFPSLRSSLPYLAVPPFLRPPCLSLHPTSPSVPSYLFPSISLSSVGHSVLPTLSLHSLSFRTSIPFSRASVPLFHRGYLPPSVRLSVPPLLHPPSLYPQSLCLSVPSSICPSVAPPLRPSFLSNVCRIRMYNNTPIDSRTCRPALFMVDTLDISVAAVVGVALYDGSAHRTNHKQAKRHRVARGPPDHFGLIISGINDYIAKCRVVVETGKRRLKIISGRSH